MVVRMSSRRSDLPAWFDDLGDAAAGRPADPSFGFRFGPFDGLARERAQEFPELPRAVELALGIRVGECGEGRGSAFGRCPATDESIHPAPSPVTIRIDARRPGVNCRRNRPGTCLPCPSCAQTTRPRVFV